MKANHLKAFVRYSNKRIVAGSLILAPSAPKTGTWKEIPVDECCSPTICLPERHIQVVNESELSYPMFSIGFNLQCDGEGILYSILFIKPGEVNNIEELLIFLNTNFSSSGTFAIVDNNIVLTASSAITYLMTCEGIIFQITGLN